jgi:hypothetical protein
VVRQQPDIALAERSPRETVSFCHSPILASICDENARLRSRHGKGQRVQKRRRFPRTSGPTERLLYDLQDLRGQAKAGPDQDEIHRKIQPNETAAHVSEWLDSPGPRTPQ